MLIYEYYNGTSRCSYEAQGKFTYEEFTAEIRRLWPIESSGKHFGDIVYRYKKFGVKRSESGRFFNTMVKSDKSDPEARVYSRVVML